MTPEEAYMKMKPLYEAVSKDEVRRPTRGPVAVLCDEFNRVSKVGMTDKAMFEKLARSGLFNLEDLLMLSAAAHGLSHAEARWIAYANPTKDPDIGTKLARIEEIRGDQIMDLGFVERRYHPPGLSKTLSGIRDGDSRSDTIADVLAMGQLAERYTTELKGVGHNPEIDLEGAALCAQIRDFIDADKEQVIEIKEMRDLAYTVASHMYEEVRAGGQFIFRNDPDRLAEYRNLTAR